MSQTELSTSEQFELLKTLQLRFSKNMPRHQNLKWPEIEVKLKNDPTKIFSLYQMEKTGGEPDVVIFKNISGYVFCDCSIQSPKERRSFCYDPEALESRKNFKPRDSCLGMAKDMGIEILDEKQYRELQKLGQFDTKTSSWLKTPQNIRDLGGGIFGDCRYSQVFVYHNGVESYYASRGFRGFLKI